MRAVSALSQARKAAPPAGGSRAADALPSASCMGTGVRIRKEKLVFTIIFRKFYGMDLYTIGDF